MPEDEKPELKSDLFYEPDEPTRLAWELWLSTRPEIEAYARQLPPWNCYRKRGHHHGHYSIHGYNPNGTVTLNHGRDSSLPGIQINGVPASEVEPCSCGRWRWATQAQTRKTLRHIEATRDQRAAAAKRAKPN